MALLLKDVLKYHIVYLQLTNAHNEITAGISYNLRRKNGAISSSTFKWRLIDKVDSQPIIFSVKLSGLVWNWVISGICPFIRIGKNNSLQFLNCSWGIWNSFIVSLYAISSIYFLLILMAVHIIHQYIHLTYYWWILYFQGTFLYFCISCFFWCDFAVGNVHQPSTRASSAEVAGLVSWASWRLWRGTLLYRGSRISLAQAWVTVLLAVGWTFNE